MASSSSHSKEAQSSETKPFVFTWTIQNFSTLVTTRIYSNVFSVGGYNWRLVIMPKGDNGDHMSLFLEVPDPANMPPGWSQYAEFSLSVINQVHVPKTKRKDTRLRFDEREWDWGYQSFMSVSRLYDHSSGFLVNDTLIVQAEVSAGKAVEHALYDSKLETGYVGLENQGAASCINSLLQTLYHIPYFRKAVYRMPAVKNDIPSKSISLALKSLFYELQYSDYSVSTKDLTKCFGWEDTKSIVHHDVQELNRILFVKLEQQMKGTVVEGTISQLFEGHHMGYIECISVNCKSRRIESFYDLQLDVKGCQDVYASLDKYVKVELLDGDNKYQTEQHGLQDARKGILFVDFPPVLQLQLKRFEYEIMRETTVKINDRYEFPLELDLDKENGKYLSPDADWKVRNLFTLHSVLVHNDGEHGGHYNVFIRPTLSDLWLNFDDERVTKEDIDRVLAQQYDEDKELSLMNPGSNNTPLNYTSFVNAYMLVYIRKSDMEKVIGKVGEQDIDKAHQVRLKKAKEEKELKRKEARLYSIIKVAQNKDLIEQIGKNVYFDIVDHEKVHRFRVQKWMFFYNFKEEVAKEFGIPVQFQRFWLWEKRQNNTYRPSRPLAPEEEAQTVGRLSTQTNRSGSAELKLFLEVELGRDLHPIAPPEKTKDDILLFFKYYDPIYREFRYAGRLFVRSSSRPSEVLVKLNEMVGFSSYQELELYEEVRFEPSVMCEPIDKNLTFFANELEDGDVVCFQKSPPIESAQQYRYSDIPSFLEYLHNRQVVHFISLEKPEEDGFCLELSKLSLHDEIINRVASKLGVHDPTKIRLTPHGHHKPSSITYISTGHLSDILVDSNQDQTSNILFYEVLSPKAGPNNSATQAIIPSSCTICLDAPLEGACIPCGHMAGCMSCLKDIKDKKWGCPVCRAKIQQVVRIYTA